MESADETYFKICFTISRSRSLSPSIFFIQTVKTTLLRTLCRYPTTLKLFASFFFIIMVTRTDTPAQTHTGEDAWKHTNTGVCTNIYTLCIFMYIVNSTESVFGHVCIWFHG